MKLQLTKNEGKPHIISYIRDDGSSTWMHASEYFVRHDLSHFAIEKTLHYTTAFMGMLNKGMDIHDFEDRDKRKKMAVTCEAWYAENMANLFLMETTQGCLKDFNAVAAAAFEQMNTGFPPPELSATETAAVRDSLRELLHDWQALPVEETMIVHFEC